MNQHDQMRELCPSCRNSDIYACTCPFPSARNHTPDTSHVNETPKNEHDSDDVLNKSGNVDMMREALRREFSLLDEIGLDQELHHCEWSIQQERKRLHQLLDELQARQTLAAEPAPLVRLTDEDIKVLQAFHNFNVCTTSDKDLVTFAHAIQNAMQEKNK